VTSIFLLRAATQTKARSLETYAANLVKLDEARIIASLMTLPHWQRRGDLISREYEFKDFPAAIKFVDAVAVAAEQAWHHPDIDVRWNKVTLTLTTHDAGGLTSKDFDLARQFDQLASRP
jgi:4a-hydroxytetrahydrobiopterin dehydratase